MGVWNAGAWSVIPEHFGCGFSAVLVGSGDHRQFCAAMHAGGGMLKVSNIDLQKLTGGKRVDFASALAIRYAL